HYTGWKMRIPGLTLAVCAGFLIATAAELDKDEAFIGTRRNYWAFRAPVRPDVPAVQSAWVRNPVDAFILQALNGKQQAPTPPAPREKLLRRLYLDVIGLPPSHEDVRQFTSWEAAVDR